jgi:HAD superfamily hydrolase (TIGR01549 family)
MGVDVARMRIKPEGPVGLKKREIVLQAGVNYLASIGLGDVTEALRDAFHEADRQSLDHLAEIIRPIDGLHALFDGLRAAECRIAVATTDRTHRARLAMEQLGIADQIDCIAGADRVARPKPAPDIIYLMAQSFGVRARSIVMVGDSVADVQTGLNAGCGGSIGVASGLTDPQQLRQVTPYVVGSIADITAQAA